MLNRSVKDSLKEHTVTQGTKQDRDLLLSAESDYNCVRSFRYTSQKNKSSKVFCDLVPAFAPKCNHSLKDFKNPTWLGHFSDSELPVVIIEWLQFRAFPLGFKGIGTSWRGLQAWEGNPPQKMFPFITFSWMLHQGFCPGPLSLPSHRLRTVAVPFL